MKNKGPLLRETVALSLVLNLGPRAFQRLFRVFGSIEKIFACSEKNFRAVEGISKVRYEYLKDKGLFKKADEEIRKATTRNVEILSIFDPAYPAELKEIPDPPMLLYLKGHLPSAEIPKVAVVGSRLASLYGCRITRTISKDLAAAGIAVVSGLAVGIDSAAHEGALAARGITLAVLAGGLSRVYPSENKKLADAIVQRGALLSEYPMDMLPRPQYFPVRNRIISGLSRAVLVVEARAKSGALITVDCALEQGRDVFAVPGNVDSSRSFGTNELLKQGAKIALSANEILEELKITPFLDTDRKKNTTQDDSNFASLSPDEKTVLSLLGGDSAHVDEIVEASRMRASQVITALSFLEIKGWVEQLPGKRYVRKHAEALLKGRA